MPEPTIINEQPSGGEYQSEVSEVKEEKLGQFTIRPATIVLLGILAVTAVGVGWFIYNRWYG